MYRFHIYAWQRKWTSHPKKTCAVENAWGGSGGPRRGGSRSSEDIPAVSRKLTWELKSGSGKEMNRVRFVFKRRMKKNGREREQVTLISRSIKDSEWLTEPSRRERHGSLVIASSSSRKCCAPSPRISRLTTETKCFTLTYRSIGHINPHTYPTGTRDPRANENNISQNRILDPKTRTKTEQSKASSIHHALVPSPALSYRDRDNLYHRVRFDRRSLGRVPAMPQQLHNTLLHRHRQRRPPRPQQRQQHPQQQQQQRQ
jgi:hypothetical protein